MHDSDIHRLRYSITGAVQGVGFRPFVYRLANELNLCGFVINDLKGASIEIQGPLRKLTEFKLRLLNELPQPSFITSSELREIPIENSSTFSIRESHVKGEKSAIILPDLATCPDCVREINDPADRRYLYPFTNCTACGPRYSIIESLPYDRTNTTMRNFKMCDECSREYSDPSDRRFHAQPTACPNCGPHVELWASDGSSLATRQHALESAALKIVSGKIIALKGLGGFQLIVDATNGEAVRNLRERKRRSNKPFAVMFPTMKSLLSECRADDEELALVGSAESPIVILRRNGSLSRIVEEVAPMNPFLGAMLPYTPLHHLLMKLIDRPVVATSGNLSEEPLCVDEKEALLRLEGIADFFLVHNRPIRRHVDDSVARVVMGKAQLVRRARGYAPLPIHVDMELPPTIAVGAQLKNTIAAAKGRQIFVSQHIGDLESAASDKVFESTVNDLPQLYELIPNSLAHDLHPDYSSTIYVTKQRGSTVAIQHHYAHVLSCMADNCVIAPVLGVAWDGTGYGTDHSIWGGEFLRINDRAFDRIASFYQFRLPGGESAIKEPRRSAAGALFEMFSESRTEWEGHLEAGAFSKNELGVIWQMLDRGINSPITSSVGRLFDAVAFLVGLSPVVTFEAEAAISLEFAIDAVKTDDFYDFNVVEDGDIQIVDWRPIVRSILTEKTNGTVRSKIAGKFHNTLVEIILAVAHRAQIRQVALSGGCFMNKYLLERAILKLRESGFVPLWHQQVPTNDGGISVGQIMAVARMREG